MSPGGEGMQEYPAPIVALTQHARENGTTSSVISVTHDTTIVEISAVAQAAAMRWVTTGETEASVVMITGATANFDHIIPAGEMRRFVIPVESPGTSSESVQGVNRAYGLHQRIAFKTAGIGSVLLSEY